MQYTHITKKYLPSTKLMFSKYRKFSTGFTLVETLVGIFIFLLAYMALASVNGSSLQDISITSRKLTAEYLAEEGIEYVKYFQKSYDNDPTPKASFLGVTDPMPCTSSPSAVGCDFYLNPGSQDVTVDTYTGPLNQYPYGFLVPSSVGSGYSGLTTVSGYERHIYIDDITQNALESQTVKVTSEVTYLPSQPPVVVTAIIHFNF